jgi:hypothetical protein
MSLMTFGKVWSNPSLIQRGSIFLFGRCVDFLASDKGWRIVFRNQKRDSLSVNLFSGEF